MAGSPGPGERPPLVVTIGGGGSYAFGFAVGIALGMREEGIDISRAPLIGTSGGSHAAVAIAAGLTFADVEPIWRPYVESVGSFWVRALPLAEALYGGVHVEHVAGVAVRLWLLRRELLWAPQVSPALLVAASSSPAPFVRPTRVGRHRYVDGGFRSNTSADLAPAADLNLVLAPLADRSQGFVGRRGLRQAVKESARWRERTGGRTIVVAPDEEMLQVRLRGMKDMGDMTIGQQIHDLGRPLGHATAKLIHHDHPAVAARLATIGP